MNVTLRVWRQKSQSDAGAFEDHPIEVMEEMSFLEVLDVINDGLIVTGKEPIAFEHDCREGICGACGGMVNGRAHGPGERSTLCQVHMRSFKDGDVITLEPFRAASFPIIKDLVVDRGAFDRIIQSGGYIDIRTGSAPDANTLPVGKELSDMVFDFAACIGCGACVAACPNASASLFTAAKISHLNPLPQGKVQKHHRTVAMVEAMDREGFGSCTNHGECEAVCPKGISISGIARMNRDLVMARLSGA
ncbi:MAG: succinate dehydrogenase / fumarate reductase iron-sulfur subunit [Kiritimatiellia bacterium]|jgi:succinate dehydrogenase / fumarate reductase iron-sulfur subunit